MTEEDPNSQGGGANESTPYVTADVAWEMSKRAAAEARAEAMKDAQVQMQNRQPQSNTYPQNNREMQNNRYPQDNRETQNNGYPQDNRDYRRDRDNDYEDRGNRRKRRRDEEEEEEDLVGFSPKLIKQLQTTVGVFNTLKDFSSNPMQKAIEDRIGGLAAGIIENAFSVPRGPPPKRDMIDTFLNSQMAFGIGQGLGSRAPELVETLSKSFGKEKAEGMIDGMIGKYAGGGGGQRKIESGERERERDREEPSEPARPSPMPQKSEDQSNIELLLSLDPNNPEHVAAYAESQGGISIDVARKMLMIHQDDIIKRMKSQGADTTVIESQRGSRIGQDNPSQRHTMNQDITPVSESRTNNPVNRADVAPDYQTPPVQQVPHVQQPPPVQRAAPAVQTPHIQQPPPVQKEHPSHPTLVPEDDSVQEDMQYMEQSPESISDDYQKHDQEYAEYKDIGKDRPQERNVGQNQSNNQQAEIMKAFADDIGKVMGDVIGKIEGLNNTVFSLQTELNEIKKQKTQPAPVAQPEYAPVQQKRPDQEFFPEQSREPRYIQDPFQERTEEHIPIQDPFMTGIQEHVTTHDSFPEGTQEHIATQDSFLEEIQEPTTTHDSLPEITRKPRFARDFFPTDDEREPEETRYNPKSPGGVQNTEEQKPETREPKPEIPKQKTIDMENFFPEKVQNVHDFERELEEETKRAMQSMKQANIGEIPKTDVESKEVEIVKKPIVSIVNKKKVRYLPKQKGDNVQSENKNKEIIENNSNIENNVNSENGENSSKENSSKENSNIGESSKDDIHDDINKNKAE